MEKSFRRYLLTGIAILLPLTVTVWLLWVIFEFIDNIVGGIFEYIIGFRIPGLGFAFTVLFVFLVGVFATNIMGRKLIEYWENIFLRIPLVNSIYRVVQQIVDTIGHTDEQVFRQVVLVEYPRRESWVIAFLVGDAREDLFGKTHQDLVKVFVPTVPNPTSGFLIIVPRTDLTPLSITVEEGFKIVLSAGIVLPPPLQNDPPDDTSNEDNS